LINFVASQPSMTGMKMSNQPSRIALATDRVLQQRQDLIRGAWLYADAIE
jgi:hypothetical protein